MGAEEKVEAASVSASAPSGSGGGKLIPILTILNLVATLGMIGVLFIAFQRDHKKPSIDDISAHAPAHGAAEGEKGEKKAEHGGGHGSSAGKEAEKKPVIDFGKMVTLEQFVVNLSTAGSVAPKFVKVNVSIEVPNADVETEVTSKMPQVRNVIIDLFNSKKPSDLATVDGREYLKEEIRNALNAFMVSGKVKNVFFTNFALSS